MREPKYVTDVEHIHQMKGKVDKDKNGKTDVHNVVTKIFKIDQLA